jgi:hemolysin III
VAVAFFHYSIFNIQCFLIIFAGEIDSTVIRYTKKEEIWNAASHGGGILLGVVFGIIFLVWCFQADNNWARWGVILYLFGMLASYIASTLYHSMKHHSKWKERLRKWDHAAIYWHIAGSYSPLTLVALRKAAANYSLFTIHFSFNWGWALFVFVWACAIAGTIISFVRLKEHSNVETFCFVGMGLSILVAFKPLMDTVSAAAVIWLIAEGVSYITGAVFYSFNKTKYMHSVFHFFVLAGSVCHIIAVWDVLMEQL